MLWKVCKVSNVPLLFYIGTSCNEIIINNFQQCDGVCLQDYVICGGACISPMETCNQRMYISLSKDIAKTVFYVLVFGL